MSTKPFIILGEARESDSEEEIDVSVSFTDYREEDCRGKIVSGEAPESDEEYRDNQNQIVINEASPSTGQATIKKQSHRHPSILGKKLYEKNVSLRKNLLELISQVARNTECELNNTNQRLLKCQVQVQQGVEFLKIMNSNLSLLDSELQSMLSTKYLPVIKQN